MDNNFLLIIVLIAVLYILFKNNVSNENFGAVYDGDILLERSPPFFVYNKEDCNPDIYDIEEYISNDDEGNPILDENGAVSIIGYMCSIKSDVCPYVTKYIDGQSGGVEKYICNDKQHYRRLPTNKVKPGRNDLCRNVNKKWINVEETYNKKLNTWEPVGRTKSQCVTTLNLKK
jgi:hypothetical protein